MTPMGRNITRWSAEAAVLLWLVLVAGTAGATGKEGSATGPHHASEFARLYGAALPPLGFVRFCGRTPTACESDRNRTSRLHMTGDRWRMAYRVNSFVNARIDPVSDEELYGEAEYWAYPADAGDCEDYALLKQLYLERLGFSRSALLLTVVLDEKHEGHALLTLATDEGDFILDNRNNEIRNWANTDYTFLKRQSQHNPRQWVSLAPGQRFAPRLIAAEAPP